MGQLLLLLVVALTVAAVVFGVTVLVTGGDSGLGPVEPDGRAVPLPTDRPLRERDFAAVRFDTAVRGYRMAQVDQALRRAAYDIGYKEELIAVLEAEVRALRDGRLADADELHQARQLATRTPRPVGDVTAGDPAGTPALSDPAGTPVPSDPAGTPVPSDPAGTPALSDPAGTPASGDAATEPGQIVVERPETAEADRPAGDDPAKADRPAGDDPVEPARSAARSEPA